MTQDRDCNVEARKKIGYDLCGWTVECEWCKNGVKGCQGKEEQDWEIEEMGPSSEPALTSIVFYL